MERDPEVWARHRMDAVGRPSVCPLPFLEIPGSMDPDDAVDPPHPLHPLVFLRFP